MPIQPPAAAPTHRSASLLPAIAAGTACAFFFVHSLAVIFGSELTVMEWLYDDCFYYMIVAKHFSERHISSFDGVTVTSGYHPLWMWLCALIYGLRGRLDLTYVRCCMALALCISGSILLATLRYALKYRRNGLLWALALAASSYSALNNGLTAMEWPLVLLCWMLLHCILLRRSADALQREPGTIYLAAFAVAALGSLSRSDFGLIPASYLAAAILFGRRQHAWSYARRAAVATSGSLAGLVLVFLYNHRMTGSWLQGSAEVKRLLASVTSPFNPIPGAWQFLRVMFYLPPLDLEAGIKAELLRRGIGILLAALALILLLLFRFLRRAAGHEFACTAAIAGVAAYLVLDGFNTQATYGWYTAAVTGFVVLLAARFFDRIPARVAACIAIPLLLANMAAAEWFGGNARSQLEEVATGKALRAQHPGATMGGGDVGKPSFYNDGAVFNLDGLMNNEVLPYLERGEIHCYILKRKIEYLSDIGSVTYPLTNAERVKHGEPPLPWTQYFVPVPGEFVSRSGKPSAVVLYSKTNFDAIRASGECPQEK
jgi:hypothetical protein